MATVQNYNDIGAKASGSPFDQFLNILGNGLATGAGIYVGQQLTKLNGGTLNYAYDPNAQTFAPQIDPNTRAGTEVIDVATAPVTPQIDPMVIIGGLAVVGLVVVLALK